MRSPRQVTHFTKYWMLGLLIAGCGGDLRSDTLLGKSVFIDPTNGASLSVPSNANRLVLKVWGYGGNGGTESRGGAGGYVTVTYNLTYKVGTGAISLNFDQGTPGGNQGVSTTGGKIAGRGAKSYIVRTVFTVTPNQMWQHRLYVGGGGGVEAPGRKWRRSRGQRRRIWRWRAQFERWFRKSNWYGRAGIRCGGANWWWRFWGERRLDVFWNSRRRRRRNSFSGIYLWWWRRGKWCDARRRWRWRRFVRRNQQSSVYTSRADSVIGNAGRNRTDTRHGERS